MNINQWTPVMLEQRIRDLRTQYANTKASRHLSPQQKVEKLRKIARVGKGHATRLKGFNATVVSQVMEYPTAMERSAAGYPDANAARYNGSIAWGSQIG